MMRDVVVVGLARTPMGAMAGDFKAMTAPQLGGVAIRAALQRTGIEDADEVLMGNVLSAGVGQAPSRQAALAAGLGTQVPCTAISKVCGSGMKAVMLAHDAIVAGGVDVVVAGGMESMTNAPYLLPRMRNGARLGHAQALDHMFFDGLEDAYQRGRLMGTFAEETAAHFGFSRQQQDEYALRSLERALGAAKSGAFAEEIAPVEVNGSPISIDEQPSKARPDKIPHLRPAFAKDGTVTAANSSSISDGAAALVLMGADQAMRRGLKPLAHIRGISGHAREPQWFTTAPIGAVEALMTKTGWRLADVDLFEINEAFAVVVLAAMKEFALPADKVNVNGGACALGHPIGASGARIVVTLINALRQRGLRRGVASLCIGGGEATAIAVELN